jgi:hypothetical protein
MLPRQCIPLHGDILPIYQHKPATTVQCVQPGKTAQLRRAISALTQSGNISQRHNSQIRANRSLYPSIYRSMYPSKTAQCIRAITAQCIRATQLNVSEQTAQNTCTSNQGACLRHHPWTSRACSLHCAVRTKTS